MSKVMIDYWGVSETLRDRFGIRPRYRWRLGPSDPSEIIMCHQNLLSAIVFWDDIYLNPDFPDLSDWDESRDVDFSSEIGHATVRLWEMLNNQSFIQDIPPFGISSYEIKSWRNKFCEIMARMPQNNFYTNKQDLLFRSGLYLMQANSMGISYLPHPYRAKFLQDSGIFKREFDCRVYTDIIDKEVDKYIGAINDLASFQLISTPFPVLYEFVTRIAKDPLDEFKVALDLRKDKNVALFRKSVNEISEKAKNGNLHAVRASLMKTKEICDEITNSLYKKQLSYTVDLAVTPSVQVTREGKLKVDSGFHTTFLSELANFALKGKIPNRYKFKD